MTLSATNKGRFEKLVFDAVDESSPTDLAGKSYVDIAPEALAGGLLKMTGRDISDMWTYIDTHQLPTDKKVPQGDRVACKTVADVLGKVVGAQS